MRGKGSSRPPLLAHGLLAWALPTRVRDSVLDELEVLYAERRRVGRRPRTWYWGQALRALIPSLRYRTSKPPSRPRAAAKRWKIDALVRDLAGALRQVRRNPALSALAIATLALGIGLSTAMFTIVDALVLRPLPVPEPEQLSRLCLCNERGGGSLVVPPAVLTAWRDSPAFTAVEALTRGTSILELEDDELVVTSARVTPGILRMLGAHLARGRLFRADEGATGSDDRVLLAEGLWHRVFGGDPELVGQRIVIDGRSLLVVGVLADFRFPQPDTAVWMPLDPSAPGTFLYRGTDPTPTSSAPAAATEAMPVVRWAPGLPEDDARRLAAEAARAADPSLDFDSVRPVDLISPPVDSRARAVHDSYGRAAQLLAGGVTMVFLLLCANVSGLLLTAFTARRRQFGICSALGASRLRLLRQALLESSVLSALGAIGGIGLAWSLVATARGSLPSTLVERSLNPVDLDARALVAASAAGLVATLAAGLLPALIATGRDPVTSLRTDGAGTETRTGRMATRALLVTEVALACTLLIGATLLVRSFVNIAGVDRGLDTRGVMTAWVSFPEHDPTNGEELEVPEAAVRLSLMNAIEEEVRALPNVRDVVLSFGLPPDGGGFWFGDHWLPDSTAGETLDLGRVEYYEVGADFFRFYGIELLAGRAFRPDDTANTVIIGERLAAVLWPDSDPVGRTFRLGENAYHVIGLAPEIHYPSLEADADMPELYKPFFPAEHTSFMVSLRCTGGCPDATRLGERIDAVGGVTRTVRAGVLEDEYERQLVRPRAAAGLGAGFATIAVLVAMGGLFSVLAYAVSRRRQEFGIRIALGAGKRELARLVQRDGIGVAAVGLLLGSAGGWSIQRLLGAFLYGVDADDPLNWLIVAGVIFAATLLACWRPAARAGRVDPVELLRQE